MGSLIQMKANVYLVSEAMEFVGEASPHWLIPWMHHFFFLRSPWQSLSGWNMKIFTEVN